MNKFYLVIDLFLLALASFIFYQISFNTIDIKDKSPVYQRQQSFIFPQNFTQLQKPLYSKLIYVILDGITYDFVDSRIQKDTPNVQEGKCDDHVHQIPIFNELLSSSPDSVILQRLKIEHPPKTEIKISTYLKGINPTIFSMKIQKRDPYNMDQEDSLLYQVGNAYSDKNNYAFLTYYLYDYVGKYLNTNQFALDPDYTNYQELVDSDEKKQEEYLKILKSNEYDTLFIYEGIFDEVGHLEGIHNKDALDSQKRIDKVIREIVANMDEDAILIVNSDHGKSEDGSHFSCNDDPILCDSLFFAYTKKGFIKDDAFISSTRRLEEIERISQQAEKFQAHESMISNTISNLLSIPISYISSGRPLIELYPQSKFGNRIEMLQRVLQDSFTTLEQQKQLYKRIQQQKNIYDSDDYTDTINEVNEIENILFYEKRDEYIYTEKGLEELINRIIGSQNNIQDQIYNVKIYSKQLLYLAIIASSAIFFVVFSQSFKYFVREKKQIKDFIFISLSLAAGFLIFMINPKPIKMAYGVILAVVFSFLVGIKSFKQSQRLINLVLFLAQTITLCFANNEEQLSKIAIFSENLIIILYSIKLYQKNKLYSQKNLILTSVCLITVVSLGVCSFYKLELVSFCINCLFYTYYLYRKQEIQLKSSAPFEIDLLLLNIIISFITLANENYFVYELNQFYPLVLLNLHLFSELICLKQSLFNSFYLQTQILIQSQMLFQVLGFQIDYYHDGFSLMAIIIYYLPIPLISKMSQYQAQIQAQVGIKTKDPEKDVIKSARNQHTFELKQFQEDMKSNSKPKIQQKTEQNQKENIQHDYESHDTQINNNSMISNDINKLNHPEEKEAQNKEQENSIISVSQKQGVFLYSAVLILLSSVAQLYIIHDSLIFPAYDFFIYSNEYIMTSTVSILITNLLMNLNKKY